MAEAKKAPTAEQVVAKYIELRDRRTALKRKYEDEDAELVAMMNNCEKWLKQALDNAGLTSANTKAGTFYKQYKEYVQVADKQAFLKYVRANDAWHLMEIRASKTGVKESMHPNQNGEYEDPPPPGVDFTREVAVTVRRA